MTRSLAFAVALVLLAGGVLIAVLLLGRPPAASRDEEQASLAAELRCPDCESLSVAESRTASADAIRQEIAAQLAAGRSPDEIRESFVARYGEWILLEPRGAPLWLVAPLAIIAGGGLLAWWLTERRRPPGSDAGAAVSDAERDRLASELERLDG